MKCLEARIKNKIVDVKFNVYKRDLFAIIGLSGSGKTTILKSLMGLIKYKGKINFFIKKIGYCPQENAFIGDLSIKENIIIFSSLTKAKNAIQRAQELMKMLKLNEPLEKPAKKLSGGQQKRLNIILSILHDPELIILDEPFAGLDYFTRSLLWEFLENLKRKGKTIILTTHLLNEAQEYCNKIMIINKGKRFAIGSLNDIKKRLKIEIILRVRFSYAGKERISKIKDFCKHNEIKLIEINKKYATFGLLENKKKKLSNLLKNLKAKIIEYREPDLNDVFMVSLNA